MKFLLDTRTSGLFCFLVIIQAIALCLAAPSLSDHLSTLLTRDTATCENFPGVAAGRPVGSDGSNMATALAADGRLHRRMAAVRWCSPSSSTSLILSVSAGLTRAATYPTLAEAFDIASKHILEVGDSALLGGVFNFETEAGALISIWNANNHQTTWGVLRAAILALADYMEKNGYGEVIFNIYDGTNQVGAGHII